MLPPWVWWQPFWDTVYLTYQISHVRLLRYYAVTRNTRNKYHKLNFTHVLHNPITITRITSQHLSDASRELATLTFDLEGHGACCWCGSSCCVGIPSLKFVGLPVRKILDIYCVSITRPGDLWPFDLKIGSLVTRAMGFHPAKFGLPRPFFSPVMLRHATDDGRTDRQTDNRGQFIMPLPYGGGHNNNSNHNYNNNNECYKSQSLQQSTFEKYWLM